MKPKQYWITKLNLVDELIQNKQKELNSCIDRRNLYISELNKIKQTERKHFEF